MTRVLDDILRAKREELARLAGVPSPTPARRPRATAAIEALRRPARAPLRLIAEIKRRSPSAGALSTALGVGARAAAYARGGVAMISVLCDGPFFDGSFAHLGEARAGAGPDVPLLAKEFILGERQLDEAAAHGADAALLIARIVDAPALARLVAHARAIGLEPLVEVVTHDELAAALDAGALAIGVNARDLDTLAIDPERAARVLAAVPRDRIGVHLSGLKAPADVAAVASTVADAALVGEALMRLDDPAPLLRQLQVAAGA